MFHTIEGPVLNGCDSIHNVSIFIRKYLYNTNFESATFNPVTEILYDLPADNRVQLLVYDLMGREVVQLVNEFLPAGYHRVTWHAKDTHGQPVSAGIYFYQLRSGSFVRTQKMILLK